LAEGRNIDDILDEELGELALAAHRGADLAGSNSYKVGEVVAWRDNKDRTGFGVIQEIDTSQNVVTVMLLQETADGKLSPSPQRELKSGIPISRLQRSSKSIGVESGERGSVGTTTAGLSEINLGELDVEGFEVAETEDETFKRELREANDRENFGEDDGSVSDDTFMARFRKLIGRE
jgi:hypothetical protein